jgi:hypothetical protein
LTRHLVVAALFAFLGCIANGQEGTSEQLTGAKRERLIEAVAEKIDRLYPVEDVGRRTREGILGNLRSGRYDGITTGKEFAARLTADMEELSRDRHLDLYHDPTMAREILAREADGDAQAGPNPTEIEHARWENFGFKELRILDGQVGYLDLRMFFAAKHAGSIAVAAMDFLSRSNAVIIDLRLNGGGWDDMVTLLAGYFVDIEESEVVAVSRYTPDESYFASMVSAYVPGEKLTGIPVYILVSGSTASAAEAFASIVKHLNEDVVLVGRTTAGAENPVEMFALDSEFVLKIPCYKKVYFGTRSGWEGKGIQPDVEVAADQALETAHLHALQTLRERLTDDIAREKLQWGIDGRRAVVQPAEVFRETLESYAGRYRSARIALDGDELYVQFGDPPRRKLFAVSDDYFVVEGRDDLRLRFVSERGRVVALERIYSDGYRSLASKE